MVASNEATETGDRPLVLLTESSGESQGQSCGIYLPPLLESTVQLEYGTGGRTQRGGEHDI